MINKRQWLLYFTACSFVRFLGSARMGGVRRTNCPSSLWISVRSQILLTKTAMKWTSVRGLPIQWSVCVALGESGPYTISTAAWRTFPNFVLIGSPEIKTCVRILRVAHLDTLSWVGLTLLIEIAWRHYTSQLLCVCLNCASKTQVYSKILLNKCRSGSLPK